MSSVWKPLPDKENPVLAIKQPSKVRANGPIKISNRGAIPKKQVFGDLKNTIQNLKADNGECGIRKSSKSVCSVSSSDVKLCDENWPEPELLPTMHAQEDDYEEFLLPGLQFSKLELEDLSDVFGKTGRPLPLNMEPDSPLSLPQGTIHLDIRLEFPDDSDHGSGASSDGSLTSEGATLSATGPSKVPIGDVLCSGDSYRLLQCNPGNLSLWHSTILLGCFTEPHKMRVRKTPKTEKFTGKFLVAAQDLYMKWLQGCKGEEGELKYSPSKVLELVADLPRKLAETATNMGPNRSIDARIKAAVAEGRSPDEVLSSVSARARSKFQERQVLKQAKKRAADAVLGHDGGSDPEAGTSAKKQVRSSEDQDPCQSTLPGSPLDEGEDQIRESFRDYSPIRSRVPSPTTTCGKIISYD